MSDFDIESIIGQFKVEGRHSCHRTWGGGHINDTFRVWLKRPDGRETSYILQHVNEHVFHEPAKVMENMERVTAHLRRKIRENPMADRERQAIQLVHARSGKSYFKDAAGRFWRCCHFIDRSRTYEMVVSVQLAYESGHAFGAFQALLVDLPGGALHETIPHFHDMERRLENFRAALRADRAQRAAAARAEIAFVEERAEDMCRVARLKRQGRLPERITHNDTKINNVLFDANDKAICVVDLDTIMTGVSLYDFGDAVRTTASTAAEDERDTDKMGLNLEYFREFTRGYLRETAAFLEPAELDNMAFSARMMTFIIGLRFLTDFLDGDRYFKTAYPEHNLVRARSQFKLCRSMEAQAEAMERIVRDLHRELRP